MSESNGEQLAKEVAQEAKVVDDSLQDDDDEQPQENSVVEEVVDKIITLGDYIDEQEAEQEAEKLEYAAVLGGSDHKECTYAKGYIKRQALYACLTCNPEARTDPAARAGVCLACSYACHSSHDLIELYTKRAFRCDCGTSRILAVRCRLDEQKPDANDANAYNQNFSGVYCTCNRPYPDPEDPVDDEMIQCVVCEDWFHCRHLVDGKQGGKVPPTGDFAEMVCGGCMERNEFLQHYVGFSVQAPELTQQAEDVEVVATAEADEKVAEEAATTAEPTAASTEEAVVAAKDDSKDGQFTDEINQCIQDILEINKASGLGEDGEQIGADVADVAEQPPAAKKQKLNDASERPTAAVAEMEAAPAKPEVTDEQPAAKSCRKPRQLPQSSAGSASAAATFWPDGWRSQLCDCAVCALQMRRKRVEFLLDPEDTVRAYEEKGLAKANEEGGEHPEYDRALDALSQMDRGSQINMIVGYNKLKDKLKEFLNGFVANEQVITEADIKRFFRMMREEKQPSGGGGGGAATAEGGPENC